jgi:ATP-dependent helicase/nuclease subunit A
LTSELIQYLLATSGVMAPLNRGSDGPQRVSNVFKLIDLARQFEAEGLHTLVDFVDFLHAQIEEEEEEAEADLPEGGGVQIMTVHQAKGLEFPLVILPDLGYRFRRDSGLLLGRLSLSPPLEKGGQGGVFEVGWQLAVDTGKGPQTAMRQLLEAEAWQRTVAEEKRLLYVACTRARDTLWLCVREPRSGVQLPPNAPRRLDGARSWNDWVWLRLRESEFGWLRSLPTKAALPPPPTKAAEPVEFDPAAFDPGLAVSNAAFDRLIPHPSSLILLRSPSSPSATDRNRRGLLSSERFDVLVHRLLENDVPPERAAARTRAEAALEGWRIGEAEAEEVAAHVARVQGWLATQPRDSARDWRAVEFEAEWEGQVWAGCLDRLFWDPEAEAWVLVDFATDRIGTASAEDLARQYTDQVRLYRHAAEAALNAPVQKSGVLLTEVGRYYELL